MIVTVAGESLTLSPDRAIYWAARRTLLIADCHFGKDEIFRRAGHAIPDTVNTRDLERISWLVTHHGAARLVVLGDFFHGSPARSLRFQEQFGQWLELQSRLQIEIVAGNHDRHGGVGWWQSRLHWHRDPCLDVPFLLTHQLPGNDSHYALSGHIHPVVRLHSRAGDRARLPVFWFRRHQAVLPAFGSFTGGANIRPEPGDRIVAIADGALIEVPTG